MKIGIDIRTLSQNSDYNNFIENTLSLIATHDTKNQYTVYHSNTETSTSENISAKKVGKKNNIFDEFFGTRKIFQSDKNTVEVFFERYGPKTEADAIIFVPDLKEISYPQKKIIFQKQLQTSLFRKAFAQAKKIICFQEYTKTELNELFNVDEEKVEIISAHFLPLGTDAGGAALPLDVKKKHRITGEYFIYDGEIGEEKNIEKIIEVIQDFDAEKKDLTLMILGEDVSSYIPLREAIIEANIKKKIQFVGKVSPDQERAYYQQSLGVIYPDIYPSFPFSLSRALYYQCPIFSSKMKHIQEIFGESVLYFNPFSKKSIADTLMQQPPKDFQKKYSDILAQYSGEKHIEKLLEIITTP